MKGVILCAGKGTRMQPFSLTTPKTMLPVVNRPLVAYCLEKFYQAGIEEIAVVVHPEQHMLIGYLNNLPKKPVICYQKEQLGIAHALKLVESFVGTDSFILLLGDNLIKEPIETLIHAFEGNHGSILLSEVENPSDYGVAEIVADRAVNIVEKPVDPKSNLAVIGMYHFSSVIFKAIRSIDPSPRGEYEITDAIQWLIHQGYAISYSITKENYTDVGTIDRWLAANKWMLFDTMSKNIRIGKNTKLENCILKGPIVIGDNCILSNATIGPYVTIGDNATIENCSISQSICLDHAVIQDLARPVMDSVIGQHTRLLGDHPEQEQAVRLVLGDHSRMSIVE
ncbi:NTP transferase domain-containing protein [Shimazuella sp. AN120528]|uniref:sugar phosphate nucleotidyltransferase n=1 Tax=Shimazuella soli TaxID=1892854 RepID=UPI001F0FAAA6|nr:sugar phosphate nucleotidyltransferase [Shimazuella soli]MCH5583814.1 NTP transferase domain-containing protein [Shimazuella soli]